MSKYAEFSADLHYSAQYVYGYHFFVGRSVHYVIITVSETSIP